MNVDHPDQAEDVPQGPEQLLDTAQLADALESDRFKQFLDHIPFAVGVAELKPKEGIVYANIEFERLTGKSPAALEGEDWNVLRHCTNVAEGGALLSEAVVKGEDYIGTFKPDGEESRVFDAWSNIIQDDDGAPVFRLVALAAISVRPAGEDAEERLREKDTLLRELQHRVKNNLQMITALIRMEARNLPDDEHGARFNRLAGRVGALALLYSALSTDTSDESVDLGIYLSQIASAVMQAHAVEGIRLDLKVDAWPVSLNVAMPTGLVVNELLTNSLKHAFVGRDGGTITIQSLVDGAGCRVVIADDGVGLGEGAIWPQPGKLQSLIVQSLRQNAHARVDIQSSPQKGVRVTIFFAREDAAPNSDQ
jgi:two-component sensor histidine kinase